MQAVTFQPVQRAVLSTRGWIVKRGILYALTQTPMIALLVGYFFDWLPFPVAFAVIVIPAFVALPIWVLLRRVRSRDADDPAHHFHKYAVWALVPFVVYNVSRAPMHFLLDVVFWDRWFDYGYELTGEAQSEFSSLIPGMILHSLQGYVLVLGFYVLFKHHSLRNSLLYNFVFLSAMYSWIFPNFAMVATYPPSFGWYFTVWWAHFWMAIAAWLMPRLDVSRIWSRLHGRMGKALAIAACFVLWLSPILFVFWRVAAWQYPRQDSIERAALDEARLVLSGAPRLMAIDDVPGASEAREARYRFALRLGPRVYEDFRTDPRAVDAATVDVTARLLHRGSVIAFCGKSLAALESPNTYDTPEQYFPALEEMNFTEIPVTCGGPPEPAQRLNTEGGRDVLLHWRASLTLMTERNEAREDFAGTAIVPLASN
ncbi:MAG: hypothetical protein M3214_03340 [Actinomycetota bacterium]|nr:hypothetical protein [Actinomycetota bacterium]